MIHHCRIKWGFDFLSSYRLISIIHRFYWSNIKILWWWESPKLSALFYIFITFYYFLNLFFVFLFYSFVYLMFDHVYQLANDCNAVWKECYGILDTESFEGYLFCINAICQGSISISLFWFLLYIAYLLYSLMHLYRFNFF